jgi:hypothetical protein
MKEITREAMDLAAARHLGDGFNFRAYTPHKIAHELLRWDEEFKDADYTQLVAAAKDFAPQFRRSQSCLRR